MEEWNSDTDGPLRWGNYAGAYGWYADADTAEQASAQHEANVDEGAAEQAAAAAATAAATSAEHAARAAAAAAHVFENLCEAMEDVDIT